MDATITKGMHVGFWSGSTGTVVDTRTTAGGREMVLIQPDRPSGNPETRIEGMPGSPAVWVAAEKCRPVED